MKPHIRLLPTAAGFSKNRANGLKGPGARGGARGGRSGRKSQPGRLSLDLPASFRRVGPSRGGSPPPSARRRGAEPDSGEATLSAAVALARALACRRLSAGSARGPRGARRHVPVSLVHPVWLLRGIVTLRFWGQAGGSRVLVRRRPVCPHARLSARGGAGAGALQISLWRWSLLGSCGNRLWICILAG